MIKKIVQIIKKTIKKSTINSREQVNSQNPFDKNSKVKVNIKDKE